MTQRPKLKYFGTSGIRGRTLKDITPSMAERMARAYVDVVLSGISKPFIVIGRDTRYGAETIEMAIIAGLTAAGVSVIRCHVVPTPALLIFQRHKQADGAIMITGSHIPPDRIGLIFLESDGAYCSDFVAFQIEQRFESFVAPDDGLLQNNSIGDLIEIGWIKNCNDETWEVYSEYLESMCDIELIKSKPFHVIVDPGNGTASQFFSKFLGKLGLHVTAINDYPSPISTRLSEPIDANLVRLKNLINRDMDLGIAFDVDADRVTFVIPTSEGAETISANVIGSLILQNLLDEGHRGEVILPINTSNLAEFILNKYDIKPQYCRIGQPSTIEVVKKIPKPLFAFEESGKFYYLIDGILWTDASLVSLRILELLASKNKTLPELINNFPFYITLTENYSVPDKLISQVSNRLRENLNNMKFQDEKDRIEIDGFRINFSDSSWLLLRPSGTEPKIRIVADGTTLERTEDLIKQGKNIVTKILANLNN